MNRYRWAIGITSIVVIVLLAGVGWQAARRSMEIRSTIPFFAVTNREFSLFLWQNPEFMRRHATRKDGYLPGFKRSGRQGMEVEDADEQVVAPPNVLFRYHIWNYLLSENFFSRKILPKQFLQFLQDEPAWQPEHWPLAPDDYRRLVQLSHTWQDLSTATEKELPQQVRQAFIGWLNYFEEGEEINEQQVKQKDLLQFLTLYPNYRRSLWQNLVQEYAPLYLKDIDDPFLSEDALVAQEKMTPFLRVAFFNWYQREEERANPLS